MFCWRLVYFRLVVRAIRRCHRNDEDLLQCEQQFDESIVNHVYALFSLIASKQFRYQIPTTSEARVTLQPMT